MKEIYEALWWGGKNCVMKRALALFLFGLIGNLTVIGSWLAVPGKAVFWRVDETMPLNSVESPNGALVAQLALLRHTRVGAFGFDGESQILPIITVTVGHGGQSETWLLVLPGQEGIVPKAMNLEWLDVDWLSLTAGRQRLLNLKIASTPVGGSR